VECVPVADVDVWDSAVPQRYVNTGFVPPAPVAKGLFVLQDTGRLVEEYELSALYCGFPLPNIRVGYRSVQRAPDSLFVAQIM
jgi:hypothetical protein